MFKGEYINNFQGNIYTVKTVIIIEKNLEQILMKNINILIKFYLERFFIPTVE